MVHIDMCIYVFIYISRYHFLFVRARYVCSFFTRCLHHFVVVMWRIPLPFSMTNASCASPPPVVVTCAWALPALCVFLVPLWSSSSPRLLHTLTPQRRVFVCPCVVARSCLVRLLVRRALLGARVCLAFILDTGGRLSSCRRRLPPCLSALAVCVGWLALGSLRVRACVRVLAPRRGVLSASPLVAPAGLP